MKNWSLWMIPLLLLQGCAKEPAVQGSVLPAKNTEQLPITSEKMQPAPQGKILHRRSIQINGKKFLRHQLASPWRLYDSELSQYVTATNVLVLSCDDLAAALATAGLADTVGQWREIALHTYQAQFEMKFIEQHYRQLHQAGLQVEWLLDYSQQRNTEEM